MWWWHFANIPFGSFKIEHFSSANISTMTDKGSHKRLIGVLIYFYLFRQYRCLCWYRCPVCSPCKCPTSRTERKTEPSSRRSRCSWWSHPWCRCCCSHKDLRGRVKAITAGSNWANPSLDLRGWPEIGPVWFVGGVRYSWICGDSWTWIFRPSDVWTCTYVEDSQKTRAWSKQTDASGQDGYLHL